MEDEVIYVITGAGVSENGSDTSIAIELSSEAKVI